MNLICIFCENEFEAVNVNSKYCNDCKFLYADWCHKPIRCEEGQEKCWCYNHNDECLDYEKECKK